MQTISRSLLLFWYDYCWIKASLDQIWEYIHIRPSWSLQQPMSGHVGRRSTLLSQLHASNQMRSQNRASWWFFKVNKDDKRLWGQKYAQFCWFHLLERTERVHFIASDRRRRTRRHNVPPVLSFYLNAFPYIWISWRGSYRGEQLMQLILFEGT